MQPTTPLGPIISLIAVLCHHLDVAAKIFAFAFDSYVTSPFVIGVLFVTNVILALGYLTGGWHLIGTFAKIMTWFGNALQKFQRQAENSVRLLFRSIVNGIIRIARAAGRNLK